MSHKCLVCKTSWMIQQEEDTKGGMDLGEDDKFMEMLYL